MKKIILQFSLLLATTVILFSCKKADLDTEAPDAIGANITAMVTAAGFDATDLKRANGGYLIEGDIFMTESDLKNMGSNKGPELVIANEEHYTTTNLVTRPRAITVSLNTSQPNFVAGTNEAIRRYNALNLDLTFQLVSGTSADINIVTFNEVSNTLGSAGFPSGGNPFNTVRMNTYWYTPTVAVNPLATTIAHEIGHCIGFRHTDYMNRAYSCGGRKSNEGAATVGAVYIPGTPTGGSAASWMLACGGTSTDRPFTSADVTALTTVY